MKKIFASALFFILLCLSGLAQKGFDPGYVVTTNFDTLRGFIRLQTNYLNSQACVFMKPGDPAPRTYSPTELISYWIQDKKYYVSKEVTIDSVKKTLFLEYLVHGIADLYYLKEQAQEYFFLDKAGLMTPLNNNGKTITRVENEGTADEKLTTYYKPSLQYKRMMTVLFQDSPVILNKVQTLNYDYRSLIKITVDYHNQVCKDRACIDYTKSTTQHIFIEPWAGYHVESMGLKKSSDRTGSSAFVAGLTIRFKPFKGYSNWDLLFGLGYSSSSFDGKLNTTLYTISNPNFVYQYRMIAKYSMMSLPVSAEYTFPTKVVKPYLSLGFVNSYIFNPENSAENLTTPTILKGHFPQYQLGAKGGVGIRIQKSEKIYVIIRNDILYRVPAKDMGWIFQKTNVISYSISIGLGIRII